MNEREILKVILRCNDLKAVPRMGWRVRGIRDGESVAEHSYAVAMIAMLLADRLDVPLDREKLLKIALIHDLPEHTLGDIHAPAVRMLGEKAKEAAEERILRDLFGDLEGGDEYVRLWSEFAERSSLEGRLIRAIDKLEMFSQALLYEREGNKRLGKFWDYGENVRDFEFDVISTLYEILKEMREEEAADEP